MNLILLVYLLVYLEERVIFYLGCFFLLLEEKSVENPKSLTKLDEITYTVKKGGNQDVQSGNQRMAHMVVANCICLCNSVYYSNNLLYLFSVKLPWAVFYCPTKHQSIFRVVKEILIVKVAASQRTSRIGADAKDSVAAEQIRFAT